MSVRTPASSPMRARLLAILLLGIAVPVHGCGGRSVSSPEVGGARLSLSPGEIDLGEVDQYEEVVSTVLVRNEGNEPLDITRVKTSCGCTVSELPRRIIEPEGEVEMFVTFLSGGLQGRVKRSVRIDSSDPERPHARVWITADVRKTELARIEVSPDPWDLGRIDPGETIQGTLRIRNVGNKALQVREVEGFPGCEIPWGGEMEIPPGEEIRVEAEISLAPGRVSGVLGGEIRIDSSDPMRPLLAIPVYAFSGGGAPALWTEYPLWNFGALEAGEERSRPFRVENRGTTSLQVWYSRSSGEDRGVRLDRETKWSIPPGEGVALAVGIHREAPPGVLSTVLTFQTDDPRNPVFDLGVVGYVGEIATGDPGAVARVALSRVNRREFRWFIGKKKPEESVLHRTLVIRNDLDREFRLESLTVVSARCDLSTETLAPEEELVLEGHFFPVQRYGVGRWDLLLRGWLGAAQEPKTMTIPVTGLLPADAPQADLSAHSWNFGIVETGVGLARTIRIGNDGNRSLRVQAIRKLVPETAGIVANPGGAFQVEPGGFQDVTLALADPFHRGTVYEEVTIRTNDPAFSEVPLVVEGLVEGMTLEGMVPGRRGLGVLYSSDELGRLGPCTCEEGQIGGLARTARFVSEQGGGALLLHGGDIFGEEEPHFRLRAEVSMEIFDRIGYQAVALGEGELGFGREFLEEILERTGVPMVCLNVVDSRSGAPITGRAWRALDLPGGRVAVTGLLGPELIPPERQGELGIRIDDPLEVLEAAIPGFRESCDLVVVLAHMATDRLEMLLERGPDVDLVIGGHGDGRRVHPQVVGGIPWVQNCDRGKYLGRADLIVSEEGEVLWVEGREFPLGEDLGEDEEVLHLLDGYRERLKELEPPDLLPGDGPTFVGVAACKECHPEEEATWKESGHAHGLASLAAKKSDYDPECLRCHTTGYRREGGFLRPDLTPDGGGIQCEACHGPGSDHLVEESRPYGDVETPDFCFGCHDAENSAHFDFDHYWPKVQHGY